MGTKGDKLTSTATQGAEALVHRLQSLGDVASRKMFGGYGIFAAGVMFALVDSGGTAFLRVDDSSRGELEALGAKPHGKMPYLSIPQQILGSDEDLLAWGRRVLAVAAKDKKK
jgi:DNA transformation protein